MAVERVNPVLRWLNLCGRASHEPILKMEEDCLRELSRWVYKNVVGHDCYPQEIPADFADILSILVRANEKHRSLVQETEDLRMAIVVKALAEGQGGVENVLSKEEFYLLRAIGGFTVGGDPEYRNYLQWIQTRTKEPS